MRLLGKALTFDDVLLVPAYSQVLPKDTSLATRFSRNITLNLPLVSAAMDTVTEARLAIAIAQEGGIGIVHKNLTAREQAAQVAKVKRYESACCATRWSSRPDHTVRQVMDLSEQLGVSGFPVCDGGKVVGIVTGRDLRFETRYDIPVSQIMTPRERWSPCRTAPRCRGQGAAEQAQARAPAGGQRRLRAQGPDHRQGHHQADQFPQCRARCATLASCAWAPRWAWARAPRSASRRWCKAGVDAIVVDTAHGHSKGVIERVRWVKRNYPQVDVIGGNIATGAAALALVEAGADAVKRS
jgi:IMP dehydrogenase